MPSRDFTNEDLFSSPMMSMHNSTHSSQINTVGPAMSLRTSCWLLPQNEQRSGFLVSPLLTLLISEPRLVISELPNFWPCGPSLIADIHQIVFRLTIKEKFSTTDTLNRALQSSSVIRPTTIAVVRKL